jgi:hypothetical protein
MDYLQRLQVKRFERFSGATVPGASIFSEVKALEKSRGGVAALRRTRDFEEQRRDREKAALRH